MPKPQNPTHAPQPKRKAARTRITLAAIALLTGTLTALATVTASGATAPATGPATGPTVVELFHSQGCSSCPPAEADLNVLATRPDVLALSFGVTYWDRLGWKDTFASERFTTRQVEYARAGQGEVATPEFIINGAFAVVGANRQALNSAIAKAGPPTGGPALSIDHNTVRVTGSPGNPAPATIWLVRYDPRTLTVPIRAGENTGRTLSHRNVVRELVPLGQWHGTATTYALPAAHEAGLSGAVLVQRGPGGPIVAVRKL